VERPPPGVDEVADIVFLGLWFGSKDISAIDLTGERKKSAEIRRRWKMGNAHFS